MFRKFQTHMHTSTHAHTAPDQSDKRKQPNRHCCTRQVFYLPVVSPFLTEIVRSFWRGKYSILSIFMSWGSASLMSTIFIWSWAIKAAKWVTTTDMATQLCMWVISMHSLWQLSFLRHPCLFNQFWSHSYACIKPVGKLEILLLAWLACYLLAVKVHSRSSASFLKKRRNNGKIKNVPRMLCGKRECALVLKQSVAEPILLNLLCDILRREEWQGCNVGAPNGIASAQINFAEMLSPTRPPERETH